MFAYSVEADVFFAGGLGLKRCQLNIQLELRVTTRVGSRQASDLIRDAIKSYNASLDPGRVVINKAEQLITVQGSDEQAEWLNPEVVG
jgi:hypothetical protein